jgi:single-strand DNA-binding protein
MNSVSIAGTLGKDAEVNYLPNGDAVCKFSIADSQGKEKPTIWWNCQLFGKRAESLAPYLVKGQAVTVSGNITEREWNDKEGNKRKSMDVRVQDVALQGGRKEQQEERPAPKPASRPASGFADLDDDIPFADPLRNRAYCLCL